MSNRTLLHLLDASGLAAADCPATSDIVHPSRLSRSDRKGPGRSNLLNQKTVPVVSGVPDEKRRSVEGNRGEASQAAGAAAAARDASARTIDNHRLVAVAASAGLDVARVTALDDAEPSQLAAMSDGALLAYVHALIDSDERSSGRVPASWTAGVECVGCGPVWLWPGLVRVLACPWCSNRVSGRPVPSARL